jgi:hypothetical protein
LEVDDEACPHTQSHGRNRRKTTQSARSKIGPKMHPKITKMENIAAQVEDDLTQTHRCIDANQEFNPNTQMY